ncbi:MAG: GNAT family N-acetyltransferase [Chlamydiia bacterium]|nr:GNAT family N-acetyltransferase [Chlamydiia bacterium]
MVKYEFLGKETLDRAEVLGMLDPEFRQWVKRPENREHCLLLAAMEGDNLVGLIVADAAEDSPIAHIQSLFIKPEKQGEGIGFSLLSHLELKLNKMGVIKVTIEIPETPETLSLLKRAHFSAPIRLFENFFFDLSHFNPPWYENPGRLPANFSLVPWEEMTPADKSALLIYGKNEGILLSGRDSNFPVEPLNSYLLKHKDEIAGWMETHRMDKNTINYSHLFLFPEWRFKRLAIPLLAKAIRTQADSEVPIAFFELNLAETPTAWQNFIKKRLRPHSDTNYFTLYSNKILNVL